MAAVACAAGRGCGVVFIALILVLPVSSERSGSNSTYRGPQIQPAFRDDLRELVDKVSRHIASGLAASASEAKHESEAYKASLMTLDRSLNNFESGAKILQGKIASEHLAKSKQISQVLAKRDRVNRKEESGASELEVSPKAAIVRQKHKPPRPRRPEVANWSGVAKNAPEPGEAFDEASPESSDLGFNSLSAPSMPTDYDVSEDVSEGMSEQEVSHRVQDMRIAEAVPSDDSYAPSLLVESYVGTDSPPPFPIANEEQAPSALFNKAASPVSLSDSRTPSLIAESSPGELALPTMSGEVPASVMTASLLPGFTQSMPQNQEPVSTVELPRSPSLL